MPADLVTVYTFFRNADAYAAFLQRVTAAVVEAALDVRAESEPSPMTEAFRSRQRWAVSALQRPVETGRVMLPSLAVIANNAGLLSDEGEIDATDAQIRSSVAGLVDEMSDYVPEAA
jgi:hypothetical protein